MIFAAIAIVINLITQNLIEFTFNEFNPELASEVFLSFPLWFIIALGFGTVTGFIFKFLADKYIIFNTITTMAETTSEIIKYFSFAVFTTIIFWGIETSFLILFEEEYYLLGGLIGLIIGYSLKFIFDKKYVFTKIGTKDPSGSKL